MRFNWGKTIFAVYGLFVLGVIIIVLIAMTIDVDLVAPDYYDKEVKYQEEIDKINNTNRLKEQVKFEINESKIVFIFPSNSATSIINGEIFFSRPSDAKKDFKVNVETDSNFRQMLDIGEMDFGLWKIKIDWNMDGVEYLNTTSFMKH